MPHLKVRFHFLGTDIILSYSPDTQIDN